MGVSLKTFVLGMILGAGLAIAGPIPTFEEIGTLEAVGANAYDGMKLCFPYITLNDWDGDGKKDVILGGVDYNATGNGGKVYWFKNSSPSATAYTKFEKGVTIKAGVADIALSSN